MLVVEFLCLWIDWVVLVLFVLGVFLVVGCLCSDFLLVMCVLDGDCCEGYCCSVGCCFEE